MSAVAHCALQLESGARLPNLNRDKSLSASCPTVTCPTVSELNDLHQRRMLESGDVTDNCPSLGSADSFVINPASSLPVIAEETDLNGNPSLPASPHPFGLPPYFSPSPARSCPPSPPPYQSRSRGVPIIHVEFFSAAPSRQETSGRQATPNSSGGRWRRVSVPNTLMGSRRYPADDLLLKPSWVSRFPQPPLRKVFSAQDDLVFKASRSQDDLVVKVSSSAQDDLRVGGRGGGTGEAGPRGGVGEAPRPTTRWTAPSSPRELLTDNGLHVLDPLALQARLLGFLCGERVTQMTKTYNDIEAVTRLLEEKERDLELAARIGQTLLEKNKELQDRTEYAEDQLANANDKVQQLRHDLSLKEDLLRFYNQDLEHEPSGDESSGEKSGLSLAMVDVEALQNKVKLLEDENQNLKCESLDLRQETTSYEEKEKKLVEDCLQQLAEVNQQVEMFAEELAKKSEENTKQKEEITSLLAQLVDLQKRVRSLTVENMELSKHLEASQESQRKLTRELGVMKDRYDELLELLKETQQDLKLQRRQQTPRATRPYLSTSMLATPADSLASELEQSMRQELENSSDSDLTASTKKSTSWKVFETAKAARRATQKAQAAYRALGASSSSSIPDTEASDGGPGPRVAPYLSDAETSDGYAADRDDSLYGSTPDLGRPGIPGSNDLETALRRLALRRANDLNEQDYQDEERRRRRSGATDSTAQPSTPGSNLSSASPYSYLSCPGSHQAMGHSYRFPEKLQIVKPLEGSMTLRQWQHLATPKLTGLFEERPGVQNKGERRLELFEEEFHLSDFEEDEATDDGCHTRRYPETPSMYTFTDSVIRQFNESTPQQQPTPAQPPRQSTPVGPATTQAKIGSGTTTYSMSLGLAAILHERDLNASSGLRHRIAANPARVQSIVSESLFRARQTMKAQSGSDGQYSVASSSQTTATATSPSDSGTGLLTRVKSTGFALLDYLSAKSPPQSANPTPAESPVDSPAQSRETTPEASGDATAPRPEGGDRQPPAPRAPLARAGVLGALTSFRQTGLL